MMWPICNSTLENEALNEGAVWRGWTFHHIALWTAAIAGLIAGILSLAQIFGHAVAYSKPDEQRHIIRIHFMVPIYSTVSFLSYFFYLHQIYFILPRDAYAAFALASFYSLLIAYAFRDSDELHQYLRTTTPKPWKTGWTLPIGLLRRCSGGERGPFKTPRKATTWHNIISLGLYQYCLIIVFMAVVGVVTQVFDRYCQESLNPAFSHIWQLCLDAASSIVASYCLDQVNYQLKDRLGARRTTFQLWCIKAVLFLSLYQTLLISALTLSGLVQASSHIQTPDLKVGLPACLLCIELAFIAVAHIFAYPIKTYKWMEVENETVGSAPDDFYKGGFFGWRAILDALNPVDFVKGTYRGFRWLFVDRRYRNMSSQSYESLGDQPVGADEVYESAVPLKQLPIEGRNS